MSEDWGWVEETFFDLVTFFALPPEELDRLTPKLEKRHCFFTAEGDLRTSHALTLYVVLLKDVCYQIIQGDFDRVSMVDAKEVHSLAASLFSGAHNTEEAWETSAIVEPGLWTLLRRLCAEVRAKYPDVREVDSDIMQGYVDEWEHLPIREHLT